MATQTPAASARKMRALREARGWSTTKLADETRVRTQNAGLEMKLTQQSISKFENGEAKRLPVWYSYAIAALQSEEDAMPKAPDIPPADPSRDYLPVAILPTFAGLGGGGNGDGEQEFGMVPRSLIEGELRAKADDFLMIEARGDSMEPDLLHGDQVLIDKRDINPAQPGMFALWDGDAYVIKNVERVEGGVRVFSTNDKYRERVLSGEEIQIWGRPVWYARRL